MCVEGGIKKFKRDKDKKLIILDPDSLSQDNLIYDDEIIQNGGECTIMFFDEVLALHIYI